MYQQTELLCKSVPNLAAKFEAADRKGSFEWRIVRWRNINPKDVVEAQTRPLEDSELNGIADENRFESRTEALNASASITKKYGNIRSERGHWGVWEWPDGNAIVFQTCLPVKRTGSAPPASQPASTKGPNSPATSMVRISERAHKMLSRLADAERKTIQSVLEAAIDEYDRIRFFQRADEAYAAWQADPESWNDELAERRLWEASLMDGIEEDDYSQKSLPSHSMPERKSA